MQATSKQVLGDKQVANEKMREETGSHQEAEAKTSFKQKGVQLMPR